MFDIKIDNEYIINEEGTSEGTQIKFKKDGFWYKQDNRGREGLCEYLASKFLTYTNLENSEYVIYEQGKINNTPGCRSRDFIKDSSAELITFYRLYRNETGADLAKSLAQMDTVKSRVEYVISFVKSVCGVDITDYLRKIVTLDEIILNEDRHVNNLALLFTGSDFVPAPIFDNGCSLLTANYSIKSNLDISENVKRVIARPFSGSFSKTREYLGKGFTYNKEQVIKWLQTEPQSFERDVLMYQIENIPSSTNP